MNHIANPSIKSLAKNLKSLFKEIRDRNDTDIKFNCSFKSFINEFRTFKIKLPRRLGNTTLAQVLRDNKTIYVCASHTFMPNNIEYKCTKREFKEYIKDKKYNLIICDNCSINIELLKSVDTKDNKIIVLYIGEIHE